MKLIMVCSLFIILARLDLSTARTIREINEDNNDDNEFLDAADEAQGNLHSRSLNDAAFLMYFKSPTIKRRTTEDNDNELMVNEDEGSVYRRNLSGAVLEQMFSTIRERAAKSNIDDDVIDDLNEFMLDEKNAHEIIDLLFEGMSGVSLEPQVQTFELVDVLKLTDQPIINAIQKYCPEIMITMGDLQQKQKSAECRPKLAAGIK
ncbi:unnamed protein product [Didymodactylos carnosus]|uniref:Uncharacterized protein n=1 Tax=Didymodactylos carnosus TaxID=1234261 RepID=A0A815GRQ8_9BILA|nr:unnamed protein product [Didymodactylos carnosus]CAF4207767.1 unnamed protein product [Didymodactylos carnosus]